MSHAIAIVRLLGNSAEPLGVNAIARALGLNPSSCLNLLRTLHVEGLVEADPAKRYTLGIGLLELAQFATRRDFVAGVLRGQMETLALRHDAAIGLWRLDDGKRLSLIALAESDSSTRVHMTIGQRHPLGSGATGRALLAASGADEATLRAAYGEVRWETPLSFAAYKRQIGDARRKGYAIDRDSTNRGFASAACAARIPSGRIGFCLSATTFSAKVDDAALAAMGESLEAASRIGGRRQDGQPA